MVTISDISTMCLLYASGEHGVGAMTTFNHEKSSIFTSEVARKHEAVL